MAAKSHRSLSRFFALFMFVGFALFCDCSAVRADDAAKVEFFENRVRPVLAEHCYDCHNSVDTAEGGLAVDYRDGIRAITKRGNVVTPGKPAESLLLRVIRHEIEGVEMPEDGAKLDERVVADIEKWILDGAIDPRDQPPTAGTLAEETAWEAKLASRKKWWSFQPIRNYDIPDIHHAHSPHPVDRFIEQTLRKNELVFSPRADRRTLIRRLSFVLTGLPPKPGEIEAFVHDKRDDAYERLVDRLLDSPHFGERWARHWMDWIRYAESHGSEGDPNIDNAWHHRDYLIRAFNADVPYDQLVREHVAGDLLPAPRLNKELGFNESLIATAHWRMVFHGFAPTDALDEKVRFTDDQINSFSKAFLGLTISCARCHDHKFDAISQKDYYALFGILGSCRPGRFAINLPEKLTENKAELQQIKKSIREAVAQDWLEELPSLTNRLLAEDSLFDGADKPTRALYVLHRLKKAATEEAKFEAEWNSLQADWRKDKEARDSFFRVHALRRWKSVGDSDFNRWFRYGTGLAEALTFPPGGFAIAPEGETVLTAIYPAAVYSHAISDKHAARLSSPDFVLDGKYEVLLHVIGSGGAASRYVVQNYPRNGTVYPVRDLPGQWQWQHYDVAYWDGDSIHIELTTAKDAPLLVKNNNRSWFGIRHAAVVPKGTPSPSNESFEMFDQLVGANPTLASYQQAVDLFVTTLRQAVIDWKKNKIGDANSLLLNACMKQGVLSNRLVDLPQAESLINRYRVLESEIEVPVRVPGIEETIGRDQPLFDRGNHKRPLDTVPRRFLEAIDDSSYDSKRSGRLELSNDLLRDDNPLTRRVIVNRIWHHLFGQGICSTPDNLGKLGEKPSHSELLDYLARHFSNNGWSIKQFIRFVVTSETWKQNSRPSDRAKKIDPKNQLLSHANVRRLEAEAIRDSLLSVSGVIEHRLFGPPVDGNSPRRSIYVRVRRNSLDPFLRAFDFPEPFATKGRRDVTNVPAQSLTMMNDPQVTEYANAFADRIVGSFESHEDRIRTMFEIAFGRPPTPHEQSQSIAYLQSSLAANAEAKKQFDELQHAIRRTNRELDALLDPVREQLLRERSVDGSVDKDVPRPFASWDFENNLKDDIGTLHGTAHGGARVEDGALVLEGNQHVTTASLQKDLSAKTLEAWVVLDNLEQRGGGVITIETTNGVTFDSIVFGEQAPGHWLAGSDTFSRTTPFEGPRETEANSSPVHFAISYHEDGKIIGFRNGKPYGLSYRSNGPQRFESGDTIIGFGCRHLPAQSGKMLRGKILHANLYDRALSSEEVLATSGMIKNYVSDSAILDELTDAQRDNVARIRSHLEESKEKVSSLALDTAVLDEKALWTDLAHALFIFKEFVYVR